MHYDAIPAEMRAIPQWVVWRFATRNGETKKTKIPHCPVSGRLASVNDQYTWNNFETCLRASHEFDGLGFVLTANDPFAFIDLDSSNDPAEVDLQIRISNSFETYQEISPGGGLHIICKGSIPVGRRKGKIEVYSSGRYLTMTGNVYRDSPITTQQTYLSMLWESLETKPEKLITKFDGNAPQMEDDRIIWGRASEAKNGDKFDDLWNGIFQKYYPSQSEADLALMNILAFYTQNREQLKRMFLMSGLGQREKASRTNYVDGLISKSFDKIVPPIDMSAIVAMVNDHKPKIQPLIVPDKDIEPSVVIKSEPIKKYVPEKIEDSIYSMPTGLMGSVAQFIYQSAPRPVPEIALAGAIGFMAGLAGRAYNVSSTGLNQYVLLLADTGTGKEAIASGISRLVETIKFQMPQIVDFIGPGDMASGQGLLKYLSEHQTKSFVTVLGEFGLKMQAISSPKAMAADVTLKKAMLDLFNKSGYGNSVRSTAYSDQDKNTKIIDSPAFSLVGESVPGKFYDLLDEDMIASGLLPRFLVIEYLGARPKLNEYHNSVFPSIELIQGICNLTSQVLAYLNARRVYNVTFRADALEFLRELNQEADDKINSSKNDTVRHLWNRSHIKTMKLAALVAVGDNYYEPIVTLENAQWAEKIIRFDIVKMTERFQLGQVGTVRFSESTQIKEIVRCMAEYLSSNYQQISNYGASAMMHAQYVIPYNFLSKRLTNMKTFKNDPAGPSKALKRSLATMAENADIIKLQKIQLMQMYDYTGDAYVVRNMSILDEAKRIRIGRENDNVI